MRDFLRANGDHRKIYDRLGLTDAPIGLAAWLRRRKRRHPKLTDRTRENLGQTLTFCRLPRQHHRHMKGTNLLDGQRKAALCYCFLHDQPGARSLRARSWRRHEKSPATGAHEETRMKWRIGEVTVTKIVEMEVAGGTRFILPQATREAALQYDWMQPHFMTPEGRLIMSIHALVIETPQRRIIVDTCLGNDKQGRDIPGWNGLQTDFLEQLARAGYPRESIDTVMCTHLHVDHVGWNTMLVDGRWVPTFPGARYLMGRVEFEYWTEQHRNVEPSALYADSIEPVFAAGLVDLVETDAHLCDGISLVPTTGHTPGHVSVRIESAGEQALITGDFVHHPCQLARPDWAATVDYDAQQSTATRRRMFDELADTPVLVIGTHFAGATAGHIVRDGDAWRLQVQVSSTSRSAIRPPAR